MTRRAFLEDPKLPMPVTLPEALYLELTVGQMSPQETTIFECSCIGDDLTTKKRSRRPKYTLERIKRAIDACSNPPHFRGVKTPITELLDQEGGKATSNNAPEKDEISIKTYRSKQT